MRFNKAHDDAKISVYKASVKLYYSTPTGFSEILMVFITTSKVVLYLNRVHYPFAIHNFKQFLAFIWPVKTCCHKYKDVRGLYASIDKLSD